MLGSAISFSRKDAVSDSEKFYVTVYEFLTNEFEQQNVGELLQWWDKYVSVVSRCAICLLFLHRVVYSRQVFPNHIAALLVPPETSALARLLAMRARANLLS